LLFQIGGEQEIQKILLIGGLQAQVRRAPSKLAKH
jgi:hypothetical protein